jgi:hypothetical protein
MDRLKMGTPLLKMGAAQRKKVKARLVSRALLRVRKAVARPP